MGPQISKNTEVTEKTEGDRGGRCTSARRTASVLLGMGSRPRSPIGPMRPIVSLGGSKRSFSRDCFFRRGAKDNLGGTILKGLRMNLARLVENIGVL